MPRGSGHRQFSGRRGHGRLLHEDSGGRGSKAELPRSAEGCESDTEGGSKVSPCFSEQRPERACLLLRP